MAVKLTQNQIELLAKNDRFPVKWAKRDEFGNLKLDSSAFRVEPGLAPPPLFGQNVQAFGFETAQKMADDCEGKYDSEHEFGMCLMRGNLRQMGDGEDRRWYVDLTVAKHHQRYHPVRKVLFAVDDDGQIVKDENGDDVPMLDEHGKIMTRVSDKSEAWITVELGTIEPVMGDPMFSVPYVQSDSRLKSFLSVTEKSEKASTRNSRDASDKPKKASKRVTDDQMAAIQRQQLAKAAILAAAKASA